jgi:MarR family transcriptional repressor of emrRAB
VADRVTQILGVTALAAVDRLRSAVAGADGLGEVEAAALVHLNAWPGTSVIDLAGVVGRSQPATVRLVDRLVDRGLLHREAGLDRRTLSLVPTEHGCRAAEAVLKARARALAPMLAGLSARERATFERLLERVTAGLAEDLPGATHACRLCDRDTCASGPGCPLEHTNAPDAQRPATRS